MPSYLDLGLIAVVLISALLAMLRGFTREILAIASWIAATVAARYLYVYLLPYVKPYISKEPWASIASATAIFFVALIIVSIVTVNLSDAILDSRIGAVDRSLGFLFGAARGFVLCVIAFLFFTMFTSAEKQPVWVKTAKSRPLLETTGEDMKTLLPRDFLNNIMKPKTPNPAEEPPSEGDAGGKAATEGDSPVPLPPEPPPRDTGGKTP